MTQRKSRLALGGILLIFIFGIGAIAGQFALFAFSPVDPLSKQEVFIEVRKGTSQQELTRLLVSNGVIHDYERFLLLGKLTRQWKKVKTGEYKVSPSMTPIEVFATVTSGISVAHPVTVREGVNMYEIAGEIEAKGLSTRETILKLCKDPDFITSLGFNAKETQSLEGYLYPDTYNFNRTMTAPEMLKQMVRKFHSVWGERETARARELGMSRHEVVTLASMVEKETGAPQERPMISSVFHNRLKKRMRLQSDPTTIYGIWERYKGNIHRADLLEDTPYNTYRVAALPAGPISNPGKDAIQAALFPVESGFLFFVSHNDGTHEFTKSYEDHARAVKRFQLDPKAREGKSWRNLSKGSGANSNQGQVGE